MLKYKLDNEFELVFVVAYQKILQLAYIDKFLDDIQLEFRDKYKNVLSRNPCSQVHNILCEINEIRIINIFMFNFYIILYSIILTC